MRWILPLTLALLLANFAAAQLPKAFEIGNDGRKVPFRPYLGRAAVYTEVFGLGTGASLNLEGSPIMTDVMTLNIRFGAGVPGPYSVGTINYEASFIYGFSTELGRRRGRFSVGGGLWNVYTKPQIMFAVGSPSPTMEFNVFGSVGYRYQALKGFMFGANLYLIGGESQYAPSMNPRNNYPIFTVWPSAYLGYRIPSWQQHKAYVSLSKLSRPERRAYRQAEREHLRSRLADVARTDTSRFWRNSEFGFSIFGPAVATFHYTLYVPLSHGKVTNYYFRTGLGTAMPLLQGHVEMGMAFLWNNTGFQVGGGMAASLFEPSVDPYVTLRGKVNLAKGFSGFAGANLIWSLGRPFSFISKVGKPYVLPTVGFSYRLNRKKA
jgi:hypothetical protein